MHIGKYETSKPTRNEFIKSIVDDFCREGHSVPLINEVQIRREFLSESAHYPEQLFWMFRNIADKVISSVETELKETGSLDRLETDGLTVDSRTPYFDSVSFFVKARKNADIDDGLMYSAVYLGCGGLEDGKISKPRIILTVPLDMQGRTNPNSLRYPICHELTHVYDDWISLLHSGKHVALRDYKEGNIILRRKRFNSGSDRLNQLLDIMYQIIYLTRQTEETSFISSCVQELYDSGADELTFRKAAMNTMYYHDLMIAKRNIDMLVNKADPRDLIELNDELKTGEYGKGLTAPRINRSTIDTEEYRSIIKDWADRLYLSALKKYYTIVWYYAKEYRHKLSESEDVFDYSADQLYF